MKKTYEEMQVELIRFESEDVITTSGGTFSAKGTYGIGDDAWSSINTNLNDV